MNNTDCINIEKVLEILKYGDECYFDMSTYEFIYEYKDTDVIKLDRFDKKNDAMIPYVQQLDKNVGMNIKALEFNEEEYINFFYEKLYDDNLRDDFEKYLNNKLKKLAVEWCINNCLNYYYDDNYAMLNDSYFYKMFIRNITEKCNMMRLVYSNTSYEMIMKSDISFLIKHIRNHTMKKSSDGNSILVLEIELHDNIVKWLGSLCNIDSIVEKLMTGNNEHEITDIEFLDGNQEMFSMYIPWCECTMCTSISEKITNVRKCI